MQKYCIIKTGDISGDILYLESAGKHIIEIKLNTMLNTNKIMLNIILFRGIKKSTIWRV